MVHVAKSVLVSHSAEKMFDLVDAVEHYPAFLPWCGGATLHSQDDSHTEASVHIRYLGVTQSFRTHNAKVRPSEMRLSLIDGPFQSLTGAWRFTPLAPEACKVEFLIDYTFANPLVEGVLGPVMATIAETFVDRFVQRADALFLAGA
jgi:ribosome-associated toxin RatA of RatAB toxin-antitoxin module